MEYARKCGEDPKAYMLDKNTEPLRGTALCDPALIKKEHLRWFNTAIAKSMLQTGELEALCSPLWKARNSDDCGERDMELDGILEWTEALAQGTEETYDKVYQVLENCVLKPHTYDTDLCLSFEKGPLCIVDTVCKDLCDKYKDRIVEMRCESAKDEKYETSVIYQISSLDSV